MAPIAAINLQERGTDLAISSRPSAVRQTVPNNFVSTQRNLILKGGSFDF